jgi:DNA-binding beta-propeller fold protein YncE
MRGAAAVLTKIFALALLGAFGAVPACSGDPPPAAPDFPNHRPVLDAPGHLVGYVANRSSDSISVLDLDQMSVVGTAPVGIDPVDIDGPRHVTLDLAAGLAYVVVSYPQDQVGPHEAAAGVSQRSSYVLALALSDFRLLGQVRLEPDAQEMALSADGALLAVTHNDTVLALQPGGIDQRRASLDLIDQPAALAKGPVLSRQVKVCVAPTAVTYATGSSRAYVACSGEDTLAVVDTVGGTVLSNVPAGTANVSKPYAVVAEPAGQHVLLSNQVSRAAVLFTAEDSPVILTSYALTGVPTFAAWISDDQILVPEQSPSGVALLSQSSGMVLQEVFYADADCLNPSEVRPTADGRLFVVCEGDHYRPGAVVRLDPNTLAVAASVPVGIYPDRLALSPP